MALGWAGVRLSMSPVIRPVAALRVSLRPAGASASLRVAVKPFRRRAALLCLVPGLALFAPVVRCDDPSAQEERISASIEAKAEDEESKQGGILAWLNCRIWEPLLTARRFVHLFMLFLPVILTMPVLLLEAGPLHVRPRKLDREGKPLPYEERRTTKLWYRLLVAQMERAGPTFIKLGQWAGSRRDLFPESLCALFGRLHANGRPHNIQHTRRCIEHAFKKPFDELFEEFTDRPMGIGAVGQAYKATLRTDSVPSDYLSKPRHDPVSAVQSVVLPWAPPSSQPGTSVAIKVLHPKVRHMIARDLKIMKFFADMLNALPGMQWLSLPDEVKVFGAMMESQLDLRGEAANLRQFEHNFRHRRTVAFPRALSENATKDVLVMEYEDAVPLGNFLNYGAGPYNDRLASLGLDAFLSMLLIDNFCHADLHPGNIMVKFYKRSTRGWWEAFFDALLDRPEPDPTSVSSLSTEIAHRLRSFKHDREAWLTELNKLGEQDFEPSLVFIDAGLVTTLEGANRKNFIDLFRAVAEFDGYRAGMLMVERCRTPDLVIDPEGFALRMQRLVLNVKSQSFRLGAIQIGDVLGEVLQLVRAHHVRMEGEFVTTVLGILLLEGIGRDLDPQLDLFRAALPVLRRLGTQMRTDDIKDIGNPLPLAKAYLLLEYNAIRSLSVGDIDSLVSHDQLAPAV